MEDYRLEQAKKRNSKILITEIAIEKVPLIEYKGLNETQNKLIRELAKMVLQEAKTHNNHNEVAITFDLAASVDNVIYAVTYGTENEVDICADTLAYHILRTASEATIVILHNHPTTKTFSPDDIRFFLKYSAIKLLVVVTNQGTVHYIMKDNKYSFSKAVELYNECVEELDDNSTVAEIYASSLLFVARCSEVGLFYS